MCCLPRLGAGQSASWNLVVKCRTAVLRVQRKKSIDFNQTLTAKNPRRNMTSLPYVRHGFVPTRRFRIERSEV